MYCTSCGSFISETDKFCPNCGAQVIKPFTDNSSELTAILTEANADTAAENTPEYTESIPEAVNEAPIYNDTPQTRKPKKKVSKFGIAGLIFGILALALAATCCGCLFAFAPAVLGIIFSAIGIAKSDNRTIPIIALVLSISAIILATVDIAMFSSADFAPIKNSINEIEDSFDFYDYF